MMPRAVTPDTPLALFHWQEDREIELLHVKRRVLSERIAKLRPMSHTRIRLETKLQELTNAQLALETARARQ